MRALAIVAAGVLAGATACSSSASPPSRLIAAGPDGYRLVASASRSQLPAASVGEVTPADPTLTKSALKRYGFTGASSRIWKATSGDFLLDLAVRFRKPAGAKAFASFELDQITQRVQSAAPTASSRETGAYPYRRIPGANLFLLGGPNRQTDEPLFIEGVVFAAGTTTYLVETGGPIAANASLVERYARAQAAMAGERNDDAE